jgi:hypothetical protein
MAKRLDRSAVTSKNKRWYISRIDIRGARLVDFSYRNFLTSKMIGETLSFEPWWMLLGPWSLSLQTVWPTHRLLGISFSSWKLAAREARFDILSVKHPDSLQSCEAAYFPRTRIMHTINCRKLVELHLILSKANVVWCQLSVPVSTPVSMPVSMPVSVPNVKCQCQCQVSVPNVSASVSAGTCQQRLTRIIAQYRKSQH